MRTTERRFFRQRIPLPPQAVASLRIHPRPPRAFRSALSLDHLCCGPWPPPSGSRLLRDVASSVAGLFCAASPRPPPSRGMQFCAGCASWRPSSSSVAGPLYSEARRDSDCGAAALPAPHPPRHRRFRASPALSTYSGRITELPITYTLQPDSRFAQAQHHRAGASHLSRFALIDCNQGTTDILSISALPEDDTRPRRFLLVTSDFDATAGSSCGSWEMLVCEQ